ncbi:sigma 54-interacting transcriptional regulator [Lysobacter arvi]|uniref:Sigma 54-interacting transcriptional regulator n=1 Tax=Lysobacter arvi TaxID=3038776 RepID=A0ABU1CE35_9GAMM|nr:sigma 54-interacting transcriptional regulator [Lysobacter arvi]MDR0183464.1 sigma 54-interacting transcriptional regulator [Lysobacter arvi]
MALVQGWIEASTPTAQAQSYLDALASLWPGAVRVGVAYFAEAGGNALLPHAASGAALHELLPVDGTELEHPVVYARLRGEPCFIVKPAQLVDIGPSFEALRARLPPRAAWLAWPLARRGVLLLAGDADELQAWRADPLGRALSELFAALVARDGSAPSIATGRLSPSARDDAHDPSDDLNANFIGRSVAARQVRAEIRAAAVSKLSVLLTGETGVGKDHAAWLIHQASSRRGQPFIALNCAAVPRELLAAELFGSVRGAFTGADRARSGLVAAANGGTLFLDEIGDLPLELQASLLRVLQTQSYRPLGDTVERSSDFRLICATHQPLPKMIQDGRFRADLYYRIRQLELRLPPLRERRADLAPLAEHAIAHHNREHGAHVAGLSEDALALLHTHPLPGNVRQLLTWLSAACERTVAGHRIDAACLRALDTPSLLMPTDPAANDTAIDVIASASNLSALEALLCTDDLPGACRAFERLLLLRRLAEHGGSRERAAQSLGIPRRTLAHKCKVLAVDGSNTTGAPASAPASPTPEILDMESR